MLLYTVVHLKLNSRTVLKGSSEQYTLLYCSEQDPFNTVPSGNLISDEPHSV